ncbi:MAG: ImmA/IrrE family metallo-endopeptidase [Oscillospiraceae bacterium]|jgi:hypothetical protein|nr:ImmA/IrrE family metallo-endopeptidase [Oscillospiraceae bacterium]
MDNEALYAFIDGKRAECGLRECDIPVSALELVYRCHPELTVTTERFSTPLFRGALIVREGGGAIALNALRSHARRNYDCAHELLHYWLRGEGGARLRFEGYRPNSDKRQEWLAAEGAAELLVPRRVFLPFCAGEAIEHCGGSLVAVRKRERWLRCVGELFCVPPAVVSLRVWSLRAPARRLINAHAG